jgi:hypothetical protein
MMIVIEGALQEPVFEQIAWQIRELGATGAHPPANGPDFGLGPGRKSRGGSAAVRIHRLDHPHHGHQQVCRLMWFSQLATSATPRGVAVEMEGWP